MSKEQADAARALTEEFAAEWIAAWNAHDLARILAHYDDEIAFTSPLVVQRFGRSDGTIRSKSDLAIYFRIGLDAYRDLRFELVACLHGVQAATIVYRGIRNLLVAEHLVFGVSRRIVACQAHYSQQSFGGAVFAARPDDEVVWL